MRKETKTGIVIGIIITVAAVIYFVQVDNGDNNGSQTKSYFEPENETQDNIEKIEKNQVTLPESEDNNQFSLNLDDTDVEVDSSESQDSTDISTNQPELTTNSTLDDEPENTDEIIIIDEHNNTNAIASAEDPFADLPEFYPQQTNELIFHSVTKGDSLYSISMKYFGTGKYWEAIYKVNKDIITNASSLRIGWRLRIPTPEEIEAN